jgi:anti-sigma B factor antagonist
VRFRSNRPTVFRAFAHADLHCLRSRVRLLKLAPCAEDQMTLKIETRVADGVTIVSCHGRIVFGEEASALRETLKRQLASTRQIVLNLTGVSYIDSGGLGTLVGVYSSARAGGADIKLTGLGQRLRDTLQITKLVTVFEVYDSEQQAIAAFRRGVA